MAVMDAGGAGDVEAEDVEFGFLDCGRGRFRIRL